MVHPDSERGASPAPDDGFRVHRLGVEGLFHGVTANQSGIFTLQQLATKVIATPRVCKAYARAS